MEKFGVTGKGKKSDTESDNLHSISTVIKDTFMQIEHPTEASSREGIPSGFSDFSLNIVKYAGVELKKPVVIFSLVTPKDELVLSLLCAEAMLDLNMVRNGFIKKEDWSKLTGAASRLAIAQIFIADSPSVTVNQIMDKAKRFKKEHGELGLLAIGCIQLTNSGNADKTRQITSDIYELLQAAAKEFNVPVIAF